MAHLHHPLREQLSLSAVLEALSDPVRRSIAVRLADRGEARCSSFLDLASKALLTYHLSRLREAGVTHTRVEGTSRYTSLRTEDLEAVFPGLLPAVLAGARRTGEDAERTPPATEPPTSGRGPVRRRGRETPAGAREKEKR